MVALNFPSSPSMDQEYASGGRTWKWDGVSWNSIPTSETITITKSLTLTTDWQDTGINAGDLETGTYALSLYANDVGSGGYNNNEYYSGVLSWYAGLTDSALVLPTDEIVLHRAGAGGDAGIYVRTYRSPAIDPDNLKLQIYSNVASASAANYVFRFRKLV